MLIQTELLLPASLALWIWWPMACLGGWVEVSLQLCWSWRRRETSRALHPRLRQRASIVTELARTESTGRWDCRVVGSLCRKLIFLLPRMWEYMEIREQGSFLQGLQRDVEATAWSQRPLLSPLCGTPVIPDGHCRAASVSLLVSFFLCFFFFCCCSFALLCQLDTN